jgi:hypothetical protein
MLSWQISAQYPESRAKEGPILRISGPEVLSKWFLDRVGKVEVCGGGSGLLGTLVQSTKYHPSITIVDPSITLAPIALARAV